MIGWVRVISRKSKSNLFAQNQQCHLCRTDKHPWTKCAKLLFKFGIIKKEIPEKETKPKDKEKELEKGKASAVATSTSTVTETNRFHALASEDDDSFDDPIVDVLDETTPLCIGAVSSVAISVVPEETLSSSTASSIPSLESVVWRNGRFLPLRQETFSLYLVKFWPMHLCGFGSEVFISYQKIVHDQWIDVSHIPTAPISRVRCIGRGTIKIIIQGNELILDNVLHCSALENIYISLSDLSLLDGCSVSEEFGMDSVVHFPFPIVVGNLDDWQVSATFSSNVDPAACTSLGLFRWGVDQLRTEIDYRNLYFLEIDDSSFESEEGVNIVDGHLSFHEDVVDFSFDDTAVLGNTSSSRFHVSFFFRV